MGKKDGASSVGHKKCFNTFNGSIKAGGCDCCVSRDTVRCRGFVNLLSVENSSDVELIVEGVLGHDADKIDPRLPSRAVKIL